MKKAIKTWADEVRSGKYPGPKEIHPITEANTTPKQETIIAPEPPKPLLPESKKPSINWTKVLGFLLVLASWAMLLYTLHLLNTQDPIKVLEKHKAEVLQWVSSNFYPDAQMAKDQQFYELQRHAIDKFFDTPLESQHKLKSRTLTICYNKENCRTYTVESAKPEPRGADGTSNGHTQP